MAKVIKHPWEINTILNDSSVLSEESVLHQNIEYCNSFNEIGSCSSTVFRQGVIFKNDKFSLENENLVLI